VHAPQLAGTLDDHGWLGVMLMLARGEKPGAQQVSGA